MNRIGFGYDIHRLKKGRKLVLGGVEIKHSSGLDGHSDADVLLHAVCDALLGAAGEGDIGLHFPNSDKKLKNISSLKLLAATGRILKEKKMRVSNIDATIVAEAPKVMPFAREMRENIAGVIKIDPRYVNIKATTNEMVGAVGRKEAIAAFAVASIISRK